MADKQPAHKVFFETLANTVRWDIVHVLEDDQKRASDIAAAVDAEQSLVSHHLTRLRECGFVNVKKQGRERVYSLNTKTMEPLLAIMDEHISNHCENCKFRED
jgi:DNA-binding transcriptional ArsR family regulator